MVPPIIPAAKDTKNLPIKYISNINGLINKRFTNINIKKYKAPIIPPFSQPFSSTLNAM